MEGADGILENHLQLPVQLFLVAGRQMGNIAALEENLAAVGLGKLTEEPAQRTFPDPLSPMIAIISFSSNEKETSSTARKGTPPRSYVFTR